MSTPREARSRAERLADVQVRRASLVLLGAVVMALGSLPFVRSLKIHGDWVELLPSTAPSVRDLRAGESRVGGLATLTLVVRARDLGAMQRFTADLVPRLRALPPRDRVRRIEWNVRPWQDFVRAHRALYAPVPALRELRDALDARLAYERRRASPFFVDLDEPPPDPRALLESTSARFERESRALRAYPGGFFVHPDRSLLAVFLRTDIRGGDAATARRLMDDVARAIADTDPRRYAPDLRVEFAGDLPVAVEEHDAIARELVVATALTLALCALSIYGLFRRARALAILGFTLAVPVLVTFALARVLVGHLNASTAFLGSIVVGNGINPGIVWLARYFEERHREASVTAAIAATHRATWAGTLTASLAASLAYGSLVITGFRGFRDFGIIGGVGMVVCWTLTLLVLPSAAAAWERRRPLTFGPRREGASNPYGAALAWLARRAPRALVLVALALTLAGVVRAAAALARDPLEYDFRRLMSVREGSQRASRLNGVVGEIVGRTGSGNAIALLVPRRDDAAPLRAELVRRRDQGGAPYGPVRSLDDLLPADQPARLVLLADIRRLLLEARPHVPDDVRLRIDAELPPEHPRPISDADLPEEVAALFTERDGTRGRLLFVEERPGASTWDGRYLVAWARSLREARLPDGRPPLVVGRAPVFADMIAAIWRDGPRAVIASFGATALLVLVAFRRWRERALTLGALVVGVAWMAGLLAAFGLRLNFLNFVALPITFGIGVDYAVNVMRRYVEESGRGADAVRAAVGETGGAIVACSLTTVFGYGSLLTSANRALNSFGLAAVLGEVTCLLAAVVALPAALALFERQR